MALKDKIKISLALVLIAVSLGLLAGTKMIIAQIPLSQKLKGKILLQVEAHGEAWYVNPLDYKRYYLGRPADAFQLMKELGLGISNADLAKIPIAEANFRGPDADADGLSDALEKSLGTNANQADTDGDGYNDKEEILHNYNPNGPGQIDIDEQKAKRLAGLIVVQAEANGEAWYINPDNLKRYYLGRPADAFQLMKELGLGISNQNIARIEAGQINPNFSPPAIAQRYTVPVGGNLRQYTDPDSHYSFAYPDGWQIKKFATTPNVIQLSDAKKDFIIEKKAVITISYFKTQKDFADLTKFRIASKGKSKTLTDKEKTINNFKAYENSYEHRLAYEKTTTIKLRDNEFLRVSLVTAKHNDNYYLNVYDNILNSLKADSGL